MLRMAKFERDREDILREATALVERVELNMPDCSEPVIVGFRRDGSASFFFGPELVVHFNTADELRRGYDHSRLLKADRGRLVTMQRQRHEHEVTLLSHDLTAAETEQICHQVLQQLRHLREMLATGSSRVCQQIPEGSDVAGRVLQWLNRFTEPVRIANKPNVTSRPSKR